MRVSSNWTQEIPKKQKFGDCQWCNGDLKKGRAFNMIWSNDWMRTWGISTRRVSWRLCFNWMCEDYWKSSGAGHEINFFPQATWLLNFWKSWSLAKIGHPKSGHIHYKKLMESKIWRQLFQHRIFGNNFLGNNFNREIWMFLQSPSLISPLTGGSLGWAPSCHAGGHEFNAGGTNTQGL